jgi:dipeptidase D
MRISFTMSVRQLTPNAPWHYFAELNAIPRASKKEQQVAAWVINFARQLGLPVITDDFGNIIITKPGTKKLAQRPTVVLQGHLDMVHAKNNGVDFDFDRQGIDMFVDGDWVRAKGTTLGADNGLGVSAILAVLASKDLQHPPIEALFTLDEEQGLGGAKNLGRRLLKGRILLNLDTEEDHVLTIGCAGGIDTLVDWKYRESIALEGRTPFEVVVDGLSGGHSGMDINTGRANANKLLARVLLAADPAGIRLFEWDGGNLRNEIPREAKAKIWVKNLARFKKIFDPIVATVKHEYRVVEPNLHISLRPTDAPERVMSKRDHHLWLLALNAVHNGVYRMSPDVPGLVEASSNLAKVTLGGGRATVSSLQRSSVESSKMDVASTFRAPFDMIGAKVTTANDYPGWAPNPESKLVQQMAATYTRLFGAAPHIEACHAGLECGIIGEKYPKMDIVSFGPVIMGAHSPDERASISSFQKFWTFFTTVLAEL